MEDQQLQHLNLADLDLEDKNMDILVILAMTTTLFSYLLQYCFDDGNILDFYYSWLYYEVKPLSEKLFKAMGGCYICMNIWVNLFCFEFLYKDYFDIPLFMIVPYLGVAFATSYWWLKGYIPTLNAVIKDKKKHYISNLKNKKFKK